VLVLLGAVALTVAFYGALSLAGSNAVTDMFTRRSAVPYVIVLLTAWSLMILFVKSRKLALQRRALALSILPTDDPGFVLTPDSAELILKKLYLLVDDPRHFLLTRRIQQALSNLRNMRRIGDVDEVLATQADNDEAQVDSSYTVLRGLIWAVPVLGFIGTVWGLSQALGSFGAVLARAGEMAELKTALQGVTGGLSTAFETTLVGLVAALCIHMLMIMVRRGEEQFLDDCRDYCQKHLVGRLRLSAAQE
jgi:biopolymer transport protein ExbB/TolQ